MYKEQGLYMHKQTGEIYYFINSKSPYYHRFEYERVGIPLKVLKK